MAEAFSIPVACPLSTLLGKGGPEILGRLTGSQREQLRLVCKYLSPQDSAKLIQAIDTAPPLRSARNQ